MLRSSELARGCGAERAASRPCIAGTSLGERSVARGPRAYAAHRRSRNPRGLENGRDAALAALAALDALRRWLRGFGRESQSPPLA